MKPKLPAIHLVAPPEAQVEHLRAWLREWEVEQLLSGAEPAGGDGQETVPGEPQPPEEEAQGSVRPFDSGLSPGDVRLFCPSVFPCLERPVYVALLRKLEGSAWLVSPFSRFGHPALSGEWLMGRDAIPLRVLCLWNVRGVREEVLERSWQALCLEPAERNDALEILDALERGESPPERFINLLGPPLTGRPGARQDYVWEERSALEPLGEAVLPLARREAPVMLWQTTLASLALGADSGEDLGWPCLLYPGSRSTFRQALETGMSLSFAGPMHRVPLFVRDFTVTPPVVRWDLRATGLEPTFRGRFEVVDRRTGRRVASGRVEDRVGSLTELPGSDPSRLATESPGWMLIVFLEPGL